MTYLLALNQYDKYYNPSRQRLVIQKKDLKAQIKQRLFNDAFRASTDVVDESINFTQFAKEVK